MPQTIDPPIGDNPFGDLASPVYAGGFQSSGKEPDFGELASPLGADEARAVEVNVAKNPRPKRFAPGTYDSSGPVPSALYGPFTPGPIGGGMLQAGQDIGSVLARVLPMGVSGDDFQHAAANLDAERQAAGEGMLGNLVRGGVRSLMPMVATSKLGLPSAVAPAAPIALGSAIQGSQSLTEARDQGLPETKARQFALQSALIEGGMEAVASRFGPTVENVISRGIARGLKPRDALAVGAKALGIEAGQEVATEAAHITNEWLSGVSEDEHTPQAITQRLLNAAAQSALLTGAVTGPHLGLSVLERPGRLTDVQAERAARQEARAARQSEVPAESTPIEPTAASPAPVPPATPAEGFTKPGDSGKSLEAEPGERERKQFEQLAADAREQELAAYRNFYSSPASAADYARRFPEQAKAIAASKGYRVPDFQKVDPDLPELSGTPEDATLRRRWKNYLTQFVNDPPSAELVVQAHGQEQLPQNERDPLAWQRLPDGVSLPNNPAIEVQQTKDGTFFRFNPAAAKVQAPPPAQAAQPPAQPAAQSAAPPPSPPAAPAPSWLNDNIDVLNSEAENAGIADKVEQLAASRLTAKQIAQQLGVDQNLVIAVRAKRGIPSMDDKQSFEAWLAGRNAPPASPPATPKQEPPLKPGMVRLYHSGTKPDGSPRWVSTSRDYAANYRPDLPLHYIDVPESDPRVNSPDWPDQAAKQGFTFNFELTPAEAARLATIQRTPAEAATAKIQEKRIDIPDVKPKAIEQTPPTPTTTLPPAATNPPANPHAGVVGKIGENAKGQKLYQDDKGVRYRIEDGIRVTEPVELALYRRENGGIGYEYKTDRTNSPEWLTTEELPAPAPATPVTAPTPKRLFQKPEPNADVTEGLRRAESYYGQKIEAVSPETQDEQDAADFLTERGYTPVFVRPTDGSKLRARGMAHGKAVFIRSGTRGSALWEAVGHEIAHASGFDKKGSDIDEKLINEAADRHASRVSEKYRERMANDPELRRREGIATLVGEFLANDAFRLQVQRESPSLWQRIADAVLALFQKSTPSRDAARAVLDLLEERPAPPPAKPEPGKRRLFQRQPNDAGTPSPAPESQTTAAIPAETSPSDTAGEAATPDESLARWVTQKLAASQPITDNEFFAEADRQFGGSRAEGKYGDSRAYDALERGVNAYLLDNADPTVDAAAAKATVAKLEDLATRIPSHKSRTGNKDILQQFSTPPAYAYVAAWAANPIAADVILEPSAGTGGLVAPALNSGAAVYANEIDPARADLVQGLPVERVFREDAEFIGGSLAKKMPAPTVVVMNPPFSRAGHRLGNKKVQGTDLKHIDSALQLLEPGGRLVAIVGAGLHGRGVGFDNWMQQLPYSVRADVEVGRDVYRGYGTTFPTRILVIDKTPREGIAVTGSVESLPQLVDLLQEIRDGRAHITKTDRGTDRAEQESAQPTGQTVIERGEGGRGPLPSLQPPAGDVDAGRSPGPGPGASEPVRTGVDGGGVSNAGMGSAESTGPAAARPGKRLFEKRSRGSSEQPGEGVRGNEPAAGTTGREAGRSNVDEPSGQRAEPAASQPVAALEVRQAKREKRQDIGESTYEAYQPSISIPGAKRHPGAIVESAAMAAVNAPPIQYSPKIPKNVIQGYVTEDGTHVGISDIQLEAVAAAGQAHEQKLPDGTRRGFMIGDGTGVGKAREVVGIITDNFNRGRKKAIWVSKNAALFGPAKEEFKRIGGDPQIVMPQSKVSSGQAITAKDGIIFTTYGTLPQEASKSAMANGNKRSRLDQLVDWVGEDFDGVLVFDEAHQMRSAVDTGKGLDKKQASKQALAGVDLQARLPNARVVYLSATSATEVANLAYAQRLGLWGEGTPFATVHDFINAISAGGVAAMEKVAGDMKSLGMYLARNLSFNDGTPTGRVEYDRIEHQLTDDQLRTYDKAAEAWSIVLGNMNEALKETGASKNGHAVGRARGAFWSANQRFWNQVITAMQTPAILGAIEKDLAAGRSAVVQLTNTNEAEQNRALDNRDEEDDYDNIDLSPRRILMDYVEKSFPTVQYEEFTDDNGNTRTRPALDSEGNVIQNPEAVAMKEKLLDELGSLNLANRGALDMIIDHFGADVVAEVTGRNERLEKVNGKLERIAHGDGSRKSDVAEFMAGKKRVLIFSEAGGTGASYHADLSRKNQQKRHHYLLQAGWKADTAIQGLGRTHRSNQAQAPTYFLVHTNLKGQRRFISTIARRLAQLGALTKGQRQAGEAGLFSPADNLESTEAREALSQFYRDAVAGGIEGVDLHYLENTLGLSMLNNQGQLKSQLPPITQFMNRVLSLPVKQQNHVFDEFQKRLDARVEQAMANGTLDQGMETVKAAKIEKVSEQVVYRHPTGAETKHVTVNVFRKTEPKTWNQAQNKRVIGYVQSVRSGKVATIEDTGTSEQDTNGTLHKKYRLVSPTSVDFLTADKLKNEAFWKSLDEKTAKGLWDEQLNNLPPFVETQMNLLTGVLLPVWDRLPKKTAQVKRLLTTDGEQILGRVIQSDDLGKVLKSLGASMNAPTLTPQQAVDAVTRGKTLVLSNDWRIKRSRVDGEWSIELVGPDYSHDRELERQGVFKRRVQYNTRYFLPAGNDAAKVLAAVTKDRPITDVLGDGDNRSSSDSLGLADSTLDRKPVTRQTRSQTVDGPAKASIAAADIVKTWERLFDVPIRTGGFSKRASGIYKVLPEVVRMKESHYANLAVAAHEVAHHIDKQTHIAGADGRHPATIPDHLRGELAGLDYEPKGRLFEGFAEFVRHYLTEGDAEILAPNFYRWFTEQWMPTNKKWANALQQAQRQARQYADQSVFQRVRSAIGRPGDDLSWTARLKQRASNFGRWFVRAWIDRASPLKEIQEEAAKRGADYSKKAGVYDLFMAYDMTAEANAAQALETGVHALTDGRKLSDSLWGLAKELRNDVEREEAVAYAWARHTLHEHAVKPGYNTGLDVEDADRIIQYVEEDPDKYDRYEKVATGLAQYANGTLDLLVDAGALAPDARDRIVERYGDYYFPLLRVRDEFSGLPTGGARFVNLPKSVLGRSSKGSGRSIMDPFDSLVALTIQRYSRAVKARIAQSLAETLDPALGGVEGMGGLMDRVEPRRVVHEGTVEEILKSLVEDGVVEPDDARAMKIARRLREGGQVSDRDAKWFAERHGLSESDDLLKAADSEPDILSTIALWRTDFTPSAKKATVVIHDRSGNPVLYELDRELYSTATGMDGLQLGAFANILRSATQFFKAGAVGVSTGFGVTNLIRDYLEYQGRAEGVKGAASLGKPLEMIGRYIGYKARQMSGQPTDNALIETFEAAGGKLFTRLGSDIATRQRTRQRRLGQRRNLLESVFHVKDALQNSAEGLQDVIAWTDAPPRLAEMEAMGRELGFEARGGDWYDMATGEKTHLPEYARVKMLNAAAEATVNFKRAGSAGRVVDAFVPFWNAILQATYREARQLGSLPKLFGKSDADRGRALRYLVYLAAAASTGYLAWLLRHDDDDYREQEPWLKEGFWTWGKGGKTYLRIPKPRDIGGLVASLMEASLDAWHHDDADGAVAGALERHAMSRLPDGGGPLRAAVETLVADYDYFRDRPLTPDYLKDDPKALQFTPYTLETSKAIGKMTAPAIGLSPIQTEHLLNGSTGGAYRRWADTAEAAFEGRLGPEHVPFMRGLVLNRHQARSLDDFYTEWNRLKLAAKWEAAKGKVSADATGQKARLDDYASLMSEIRSLDKRDLKGRRKFLYEPYLVGLAREALEREPLESNPTPFTDPKLPDELKAAVVAFATQKAKSVILSHGMPTKAHQGDESYEDTLAKWEASRDADQAWLKEHESSPYVQEAIVGVQGGKGFRSLLRREGRPHFDPRRETVEDYQHDLRRFIEKLENAQKWREAGAGS